MLYRALMNADEAMMRAIARQAVQRYAGMEPGRPVGGTYYLYRTLRNLDLDGMLEQADGAGSPGRRRRLTAARGAPRARRVREPHRPAEEGDRGRDPAAARRRPRRRGDGQDAAQAAARRRRLHARQPRGDGGAAARRSTRSPASSRCDSPASAATVARGRSTSATPCVTRCRYGGVPGRAEVPLSAAGQARDHGRRRHLRLGRRVRPLHPAPRLRDQRPVLEGAGVRVHRRHRRGDAVLRGRRGHHRGGAPRQHRSRRRVGRRPQRLRPRARGVLGEVGQRGRAEDHGDAPRRRAEQLPRGAVVGAQGDARTRSPRVLAEPRARGRTGTRATRSSGSTASTPTACSSAATCASSSDSSRTSPESAVSRLVFVRHGESQVFVDGSSAGSIACNGLSDLGRRQAAALRERLAITHELDPVDPSSPARCRVRGRRREIIAPSLGGLARAGGRGLLRAPSWRSRWHGV